MQLNPAFRTMNRFQSSAVPRYMRNLAATAAVTLSCAFSNALAESATSDMIPCADTPVEVYTHDLHDRRLLCDAARQTVRFLQRYDMTRRQLLRVRVQQDPEAHQRGLEFGSYNRTTGEVKLLSFGAFQGQYDDYRTFRVPVSRALYRSFGVHEIAHAVADDNFQVSPVPWLAQEYIAAVVQFATMDPALRSRILERYHLSGFDTPASISSIYYQLDPGAFAIKSYLHYIGLEDPRAFLHDLLSGTLLLGDDEFW